MASRTRKRAEAHETRSLAAWFLIARHATRDLAFQKALSECLEQVEQTYGVSR